MPIRDSDGDTIMVKSTASLELQFLASLQNAKLDAEDWAKCADIARECGWLREHGEGDGCTLGRAVARKLRKDGFVETLSFGGPVYVRLSRD